MVEPLIGKNKTETAPPGSSNSVTVEDLVAPAAGSIPLEAPYIPTETHKDGMPKWLMRAGGGLLMLVIGVSVYSMLGIGQPAKITSLPTETTSKPVVVQTPPPFIPPTTALTTKPIASVSASFGQLGGSNNTPQSVQASSAAEILLQQQQLAAEINAKSLSAKQTKIEITDFQAIPTYDSNEIVTKMTFKITFNSSSTADINIYPLVSLWANHRLTGSPFRFDLNVDNNQYGDIVRDKHGSNTVITGKNIIVFEVSNFIDKINQYMLDYEGKFEVAMRFGMHTSDPYGFGQGNATSIENIKDLTGKAIIDPSVNKLGEVYLTGTYKVIR